jgi:HAD superfamily 5'-nucleotidase-like hydrolase
LSKNHPTDPDLAAALASVAHAASEHIPDSARIFTNRTLNLANIRCIGFDMDYTLARYRLAEMDDLAWSAAAAKLIKGGWPGSVFAHKPPDDFAIRGLVVDTAHGNILKMDQHGYVGRAYHGTRLLDSNERKTLYRDQRLGRERARFVPVDTFFSLAEVLLYARMTDAMSGDDPADRTPGLPQCSHQELWDSVRAAVDESHQDGTIKSHVVKRPELFLDRNDELKSTLQRLRAAGKRLFLLTNSDFAFTNQIMSFLLGPEDSDSGWKSDFDYIVVSAGKPNFFFEGRPFIEVDKSGAPRGKSHAVIASAQPHAGGSQAGLQEALGCHPDEVLFVGDHIYADIVRSRRSSGWRTALIAPELDHDTQVRRERSHAITEVEVAYETRSRVAEEIETYLHSLRCAAETGPTPGCTEDVGKSVDQTTITERIDALRAFEISLDHRLSTATEAVDRAFNPFWGSVFFERYGPSRFASQIRDYACVYTSKVSNFLLVSPNAYFHAPLEVMPHWSL